LDTSLKYIMRILLTTPSYPPFNSGLGNAVSQQVACFAQAGYEVVVATWGAERSSREAEGIWVESFALSGADCWLQPIRGEVAAYTDFLRHNNWDVVLLNAWQNWATDLALAT
jgi:1,2-diacylglycerol 3-alpha-glucosyltransferase